MALPMSSLVDLRTHLERLPLPVAPSITAHMGRLSITLRPNRSHVPFGPFPRGRLFGSVGLGPVSASWVRRTPGRNRWGVEPTRCRTDRG